MEGGSSRLAARSGLVGGGGGGGAGLGVLLRSWGPIWVAPLAGAPNMAKPSVFSLSFPKIHQGYRGPLRKEDEPPHLTWLGRVTGP